MRRLRIVNPDLTRSEKTYLDADYVIGATALTVLNNYGFTDNDIAIIGEVGEESSESKDVTSYSGNFTINVSGTYKFNHNKATVVYRYEYDQYEIYRYRSAAWTLISTSNIQWDKRETLYVDASGLSTDSYRYRLLNSVSAAASDYSPTIPATGYTRSQVGYIIQTVRRIVGDEERRIIPSDDELIKQLNRAQEIISSRRSDWWFLRKTNSQITTTVNNKTYGLNTYLSDLDFIDTVRYRYNHGSTDITYQLYSKTMIEHDYDVRDNDLASDDFPLSYVILPPDSSDATGYLELNVPSKTLGYGTLYIRYYKKMTDLATIADETDVPIPSILEDFLLEYMYRVKGDDTRADVYKERFWGPEPGQDSKYREPTGIRLLELTQSNKMRALGQPESMKRYTGRRSMRKLFGDRAVNLDDLRERYW
jgi:hypothetical protein